MVEFFSEHNVTSLTVPPLLAAALSFIGNQITAQMKDKNAKMPGVLKLVILGIIAAAWFLLIVAFVTLSVHYLEQSYFHDSLWYSWLVWPFLGVVCYCIGNTVTFLNYSSQHPLYRSRLVNAYLGAADCKDDSKQDSPVDLYRDDTEMSRYSPADNGGPLHIINTTLNETINEKSRVEEQDRKGLSLAVGPCGLTVDIRHHSLWEGGPLHPSYERLSPIMIEKSDSKPGDRNYQFHVFETDNPWYATAWTKTKDFLLRIATFGHRKGTPADLYQPVESPTLGSWVSISGAAMGTGLGYQTNPIYSLLLGLANIRLGYWWNSRLSAAAQKNRNPKGLWSKISTYLEKYFPVQHNLLDELSARFHGPARRFWNLSDGGHFENTACYELIRRRIPFIILCDTGEDPQYQFEDFARMVLKARNDFQAEITFYSQQDLIDNVDPTLVENFLGSLDNFTVKAPGSDQPECKKHGLLAWVVIPGGRIRNTA